MEVVEHQNISGGSQEGRKRNMLDDQEFDQSSILTRLYFEKLRVLWFSLSFRERFLKKALLFHIN